MADVTYCKLCGCECTYNYLYVSDCCRAVVLHAPRKRGRKKKPKTIQK